MFFSLAEYSKEEENWRLQYGQVVHSGEESVLDCVAVDLWDWEMVTDLEKGGQCQAARLVGRLVKQSNKLHPSMSSGGGLFRTAPICEVYLDFVRVRSGLGFTSVSRLHTCISYLGLFCKCIQIAYSKCKIFGSLKFSFSFQGKYTNCVLQVQNIWLLCQLMILPILQKTGTSLNYQRVLKFLKQNQAANLYQNQQIAKEHSSQLMNSMNPNW